MRKGFLYLIYILYCSLASYGQTSTTDTLFCIGDKAYPSDNFYQLYKNKKLRNNSNQALPFKEALDLYINFQLKATEAINLKYDTLPEVKREIESYRNQAFKKYLYPVKITNQLLKESYQRIKYFVKGRHILIKIKGRETPKDTLEASQKAWKIYRMLKSGKHFKKLAVQYSDDLSSRKNGGEIGYITAFDMDYKFESAMYNTPEGDISTPVRSAYGYHIIQRLDKIENPGKVKIRHLMLAFKIGKEKTRLRADSISHLLKYGADFTEIVRKYSDDTDSKLSDGILPWFGLFETHPAIENVAFQLKKNEISAPIKTEFGYHIIQLLDKKDYNLFAECKPELLDLLQHDNRSSISESQLIQQLKVKYHFKENRKLLSNFYSIIDYAYAELWESLFTIDGKEYSQEKFAKFLSEQASKDIYEDFKDYINRLYVDFSNTCLLNYHEEQLIKNHKELKLLLQEYTNGVLVYFVSKNTIWEPSLKNQNELKKYFKNHKEQYGSTAIFEAVKKYVIADFRDQLELNWIKKLRNKYSVSIHLSTCNKIAIDENK